MDPSNDSSDDEFDIVYIDDHDWDDIPKNNKIVNTKSCDYILWFTENIKDIDEMWKDVSKLIKNCNKETFISEEEVYKSWCVALYNMRDLKIRKGSIKNVFRRKL